MAGLPVEARGTGDGDVASRGAARPWLWVQGIAGVAAWAVGMATSRRQVFTSGMAEVSGSMWDHRLLVYLSEHWFRVANGREGWSNPSMFHPVDNDLGYTDGLVAFGVAYLPARWLGADQFAAFELSIMALTTLGFVAALWLFGRMLAVPFPLALAGAFVVAFSNNLALTVAHAQLVAVHLLPVAAVLGATALSAAGRGNRARATGAAMAFGVVVAVLLFTSFYIGWFAVLATGVTTVALVVCARPEVRQAVAWVRRNASSVTTAGMAAAIGFGVTMIPFVATYLPVLDESGGRSYDEVADLLPGVGNLLLVGRENLLWGWTNDGVAAATGVGTSVAAPELLSRGSMTPLLLVTTLAGLVVGLVRWRRTADGGRLRVAAGLVVASVLLGGCAIEVGEFSLWRLVYSVVPGAEAIRAPGRVFVVVGVLIGVAWVLVADVVWRRVRPWSRSDRWRTAAVVAIVVVGLAVPLEQVQTGLAQTIDRRGQLDQLAKVGEPPAGCTWFVLVDPPQGYLPFVAQMDAMLVSHHTGLPTINGYSGFWPPGWDLLDPGSDGYRQAVEEWVSGQSLPPTGCAFDLADRQWEPWPAFTG